MHFSYSFEYFNLFSFERDGRSDLCLENGTFHVVSEEKLDAAECIVLEFVIDFGQLYVFFLRKLLR